MKNLAKIEYEIYNSKIQIIKKIYFSEKCQDNSCCVIIIRLQTMVPLQLWQKSEVKWLHRYVCELVVANFVEGDINLWLLFLQM